MLVGMMWNDRIVALQMLVGKGCRKGFDLYMGESHGAGDMIRLICEKVGKPTQEVAWHVTSRASEDHRKGTNRTVI